MNLLPDQDLLAIQERIGHVFRDPRLLREALTHPSLRETSEVDYERLEFLGDAVLGLIAAEHLYERFPRSDEGELTRIKSALVSRTAMARLGRRLGLGDVLLLGKGMQSGRVPRSVTANATEAVIGAVFLDGGLEAARAFVLRHVREAIETVVKRQGRQNPKSLLQELTQRRALGLPAYRLLTVTGPEHGKLFEVCAVVGEREFTSCTGASKKLAEQRAARLALRTLEAELDGGDAAPAS